MGFVPSRADLDLWIRKGIDGSYVYIASFVDNIILISKEAMKLIDMFKETYRSISLFPLRDHDDVVHVRRYVL
jgi:hypothetical protein